jgi:hypothetical protein
MKQSNFASPLLPTQYMVAPTLAEGTYNSIQAAVTAANAAGGGNVFIKAGTYTEDVTVPSNITIFGYSGQTATAGSSQTIISGSLRFTDVTNVNINNITVVANGATVPLQIAGASTTVVTFTNVTIQAAASECVSCSNSNTSSVISFQESNLLQDGAFSHVSQSGSFLEFNTCFMGSSANVVTTAVPSVITSTGILYLTQVSAIGGFQTTGTGRMQAYYTQIEGNGFGVDLQSTFSSIFGSCGIQSGTGVAAVNLAAGSVIFMSQCSLFSNAGTHAITGSGTLNYDFLSFTNGSNGTLDPALTIVIDTIRPFASTTVRGVASFNPADFTVDSNGQVSTIGGAAITTINGDTGSISGASVTIFANNAAANCGSSVLFTNAGTTSTLNVTDGNENTFIGLDCGKLGVAGGNNNGLGKGTLAAITSGSLNSGFGEGSLGSATSGSFNTGFGGLTLTNLVSGAYNASFGYNAGSSYTTTETSNISIMNNGTIGESNVIRIGTQGVGSGQQNTCFVAGITGVTVATPQFVTINPSTGQLGTSPTTQLNYTNVNNAMSPYTVLSTDYYISVDSTGGPVTLRFPNAPTTKQTWVVKDRTGTSATSAITVTTVGGAVNIDGATSYTIGVNYQAINLLFNGTTYEVF